MLKQENDNVEEDNNWIFSYADMMSLLLCFFILLYKLTVDEDKMKSISERIREAMAGVDDVSAEYSTLSSEERKARAFEMLTAMLDLGDSIEDAVGNIERKYSDIKNSESYKRVFEEDLDESSRKHLEVLKKRNIDENVLLRIVIPSDLTFATASATVLKKAERQVANIAETLSKFEQVEAIEVVGHTDERPVAGRWSGNWELSAARATAVGEILVREGVNGEKLKVTGRSSFDPLFPEKGVTGKTLQENQRKNRRVEIRVLRNRYKEDG